jgi:hypothetical protein
MFVPYALITQSACPSVAVLGGKLSSIIFVRDEGPTTFSIPS